MTKYVWVSQRRLKEHEMRTTSRFLSRGGERWKDTLLRLGETEKASLSRLIRLGSSFPAFYLILDSLNTGARTELTIQGITAGAPTGFVTLFASLVFFFAVLEAQTLIVIQSFRSKYASQAIIIPSFSPQLFGFLHGQDEAAISVPTQQTTFLKEAVPLSLFMRLVFGFVIFVLAFIFASFAAFVVVVQCEAFAIAQGFQPERLAAFAGNALVALSAIIILTFNLPLPMHRNSLRIKWNFLMAIRADQRLSPK